MQKIKVSYADERGKQSLSVLEVESVKAMREGFKERGLYILSEEPVALTLSERFKAAFTFKRGVSVSELNEFTKLLRTLLHSGLPITEALDVLLDGAEDTSLNRALRQVKADICEGVSFSKALSRYSDIFPDIYVKTVIAGEKAGALEKILARLTEYFANSIAIKRKVIAALIYPSILLSVSVIAVAYMLVAVVPDFVGLYQSLGVSLPFATQCLLDFSSWLGTWFVPLLCLLVLGAAAYVKYSKTPKGRFFIDALKLKIPLLKQLQLNLAYSQFARTMSTMLEGGIPILDSLRVVIDGLENRAAAAEFEPVPEMLERGISFARALKSIRNTPNMMIRVVQVGEEAGNLGEMLENLSAHYDEEIKEFTDTITALLEPFLFLFMALVVGSIIIAMLYPVFNVISQLN